MVFGLLFFCNHFSYGIDVIATHESRRYSFSMHFEGMTAHGRMSYEMMQIDILTLFSLIIMVTSILTVVHALTINIHFFKNIIKFSTLYCNTS